MNCVEHRDPHQALDGVSLNPHDNSETHAAMGRSCYFFLPVRKPRLREVKALGHIIWLRI